MTKTWIVLTLIQTALLGLGSCEKAQGTNFNAYCFPNQSSGSGSQAGVYMSEEDKRYLLHGRRISDEERELIERGEALNEFTVSDDPTPSELAEHEALMQPLSNRIENQKEGGHRIRVLNDRRRQLRDSIGDGTPYWAQRRRITEAVSSSLKNLEKFPGRRSL